MITGDDYESAFDRAWRLYGGAWTVTWFDGGELTEVHGVKAPERPKLRVIQGGKR